MEFGNPSRFIKEIDSAFIQEDSEMPHDDNGFGSSGYGRGGYGRGGYGNGGYGGRMPWDNHSVSSQFKPDRKDYSDGEDDFRTNGRGGYRTSGRDDFRSSGRDDFRTSGRDDFRTSGRDDFRSSSRDDFRSSSRDDFRTSGRSGSGLDSRFKSVRGLEAARRIMGSSSSSLGSSSSSSGSAFGSSTSSAGSGRLVEGTKIEHQRFGVGTVLKLEGSGENAKATVQFVNSGTKQLLLKFAKFTIIG